MGKQARIKSQRQQPTFAKTSIDDIVAVPLDRDASAQRIVDAKQVPIFSLDGKTYTVPAAERAEVGLEYLAQAEAKGDDAAAWWLLNEVLGDDAVDALRSITGLSNDEFEGIMARVERVVMPKARNPKGPRR